MRARVGIMLLSVGVLVGGALVRACQILPLPFLRYRFCELKYRGAVGRRQVHCTLIVKIIRFYCLNDLGLLKLKAKVAD
jgi:hypothetical protein